MKAEILDRLFEVPNCKCSRASPSESNPERCERTAGRIRADAALSYHLNQLTAHRREYLRVKQLPSVKQNKALWLLFRDHYQAADEITGNFVELVPFPIIPFEVLLIVHLFIP